MSTSFTVQKLVNLAHWVFGFLESHFLTPTLKYLSTLSVNQLKLTQKIQQSFPKSLVKLRCQLKVKPCVKRPVGRVATLKKVRGFLEEVPIKAHEFEWIWPSTHLSAEVGRWYQV